MKINNLLLVGISSIVFLVISFFYAQRIIDFGKSYWASSTPLISLGSEFYPNSKSPFYFGVSFGGENSFGWGTGMSLKMGSVIFDISGGQLGGIFNNATGMQLGFGLRIQK